MVEKNIKSKDVIESTGINQSVFSKIVKLQYFKELKLRKAKQELLKVWRVKETNLLA